MAVLISGECLGEKVSAVFEKGLREINCNDFFQFKGRYCVSEECERGI